MRVEHASVAGHSELNSCAGMVRRTVDSAAARSQAQATTCPVSGRCWRRSTREGTSTAAAAQTTMLLLRRCCRLSSCRREAAACACAATACSSAGATEEPCDRLSAWLGEGLSEGDAGRGEGARRPVLAALVGPLLVAALPSSASGVDGPAAAAAPSTAVTVSGEPAAALASRSAA